MNGLVGKLTNWASIIGVIGAIGGGFYAWGEFNNANYNIKMMSDVGGHLARSMNIEADFGPNLLMRMKRFAMVLKQNEIKNFVIDEKGDYGKTSAENIISLL